MNFSTPGKRIAPRFLATLVLAGYPKNIWRAAYLTIRVTVLLCLPPILEKFHALPALLDRLAPVRLKENTRDPAAMAHAVKLITCICHSWPFRSALFPKACLRQSLVLYHTLTYMGYPVEFHLGVRKDADKLNAHSWVTFEERTVADRTDIGGLKIVYSYPNPVNSDQFVNGGHHGTEKIAAAGT
ncbi:MAG: lasso peptide biosynthesis B2 protein [Pyrinomonadaceae bacterium]|nr:lasso peptide biosynthesis B2 protein [Pyrinomonadaceae bacterium]